MTKKTQSKEEMLKEIRKYARMCKRIYGSWDEVPLWDIQTVRNEFPEISGLEINKIFHR